MKRLGWALFFLMVVYFIFLIRQDIIDYLDLRKEKDGVAASLRQEETRLLEHRVRLKKIKGDERIEELARTRLGLIIKGETAYKVIR